MRKGGSTPRSEGTLRDDTHNTRQGLLARLNTSDRGHHILHGLLPVVVDDVCMSSQPFRSPHCVETVLTSLVHDVVPLAVKQGY